LTSKISGGIVTFDGNQKGKIGVGKISIHPYPPIENVLFIEGMKHNLLSMSQLCDNGHNVSFKKERCVIHNDNVILLFTTKRRGDLYKINLDELYKQNVTFLLTLKENHWV